MRSLRQAILAGGVFAVLSPLLALSPVYGGQFSIPVNTAAIVNRSCTTTSTSVSLDFGALTVSNGSVVSANHPSASFPVSCTLDTPLAISFGSATPPTVVGVDTNNVVSSTQLTGATTGATTPVMLIAGISNVVSGNYPSPQFGYEARSGGGDYVVNVTAQIQGTTLPTPDNYSTSAPLYVNF